MKKDLFEYLIGGTKKPDKKWYLIQKDFADGHFSPSVSRMEIDTLEFEPVSQWRLQYLPVYTPISKMDLNNEDDMFMKAGIERKGGEYWIGVINVADVDIKGPVKWQKHYYAPWSKEWLPQKMWVDEILAKFYTPLSSDKMKPNNLKELMALMKELIKERGLNGDFNDVDTSLIDNMKDLFKKWPKFNGDITKWNVSNVVDMRGMFSGCVNFNQDISGWKVSSLQQVGGWQDDSGMFYGCTSFNQNLDAWKKWLPGGEAPWGTYKMFDGCTSLKKKPKWFKDE